MTDRMRGQVAIVTGAASGIGHAIADTFLKEGASVVGLDLDQEGLDRAHAGWQEEFGGASSVARVDVSSFNSVQGFFDSYRERGGKLDVIANCAGIGRRGTIVEFSEADWDAVLDVNLKSIFLCCKFAIPLLLEKGGGRIINIASAAGMIGVAKNPAYCASKAGVILLTKQIAVDYAPLGIRAHSICPTSVDTPMIQRRFASSPDPAKARAEMEAEQGRLLSADEVANVALFLAVDGLPNGPVAYIQ